MKRLPSEDAVAFRRASTFLRRHRSGVRLVWRNEPTKSYDDAIYALADAAERYDALAAKARPRLVPE